jgi:hypothetical protein
MPHSSNGMPHSGNGMPHSGNGIPHTGNGIPTSYRCRNTGTSLFIQVPVTEYLIQLTEWYIIQVMEYLI